MNKFFLVVFLFLGIIIVALSFSELETIIKTLEHARPQYLLLAFLFQLLWFWSTGRMYRSIYHLLGLHEETLTLSRISLAANFINVVAPSAGLGGVAVFAAEARKRGHPTGKVTVAAALFLSLDHAAFLVILSLGMIILARRGNLSAGELSATLFLLMIAISYASVLYLGYRSEQKLASLLSRMAHIVNDIVRPFTHKEYLSEERAREFAHEVSDGFSGLTENKSSLLRPILWGVMEKSLLMCVLLSSFLSFSVPFSAGTIIAGFSIAYLFLIVSPTPFGIGIVEGVMPLALSSLRVDWSQAVLVTLVYRTMTFWVPFAFGAWAFRSLHINDEKP